MQRTLSIALLAASAALAGCGDNAGAGGVTAEESQALNEAAEMLDTSPDDLVADNDLVLTNGDEPAMLPEADPSLNQGVAQPTQ